MSNVPQKPPTIARRLTLLLVLALGLALPGSPTMADEPEAANKALVRDYVEECLDGGDLGCLHDYWAAEKVEGVRKNLELRLSAFPDLSYTVVDLMAEDDRVVAVLRVRGRNSGRFLEKNDQGAKQEVPPTGRSLDIEEAVIYTLADGRIRTGKLFSDRMDIALALGYSVSPPSSPPDGR